MANGLLDLLGGALGTTPPAYLQGLLGENAVEDLRKRSIGSGIVNALIGYAAAPKNQNLGLGRILAGAAQSGIRGAQGVYDQALGDFQTQQKIEDMKIQRTLQMQKLQDQQQLRQLAPQLIKDIPAVTEYEDGGSYYTPAPTPQGAVAPNYDMQSVERDPIPRVVTPARREIDMGVLQKIMGASSDPLAALKTSADLVPALRKAGMLQTGQLSNPFDMFIQSESPQVQKLAKTYHQSYENNIIDDEKAQTVINQLATMEDRYSGRIETATARKDQNDRAFELQQMLANDRISQGEFNRQMALNQQAMRQDTIDQRRIDAQRKNQKVLPAGALKFESENIAKGYETVQLANDVDAQIKSIVTNKVDFSPSKNAKLATQSFLGSSDPEVLAYNELKRFNEKYVNDSLKLATGTQTDSDAKRAANELSNARSTQDLINAMQKMREVNIRSVKIRNQVISSNRRSGSLTEDRGYSAPEQVPIPQYEQVFYSEKDPSFKTLKKGTTFIDGNTGLRKVK